jgi:hypothetical protein
VAARYAQMAKESLRCALAQLEAITSDSSWWDCRSRIDQAKVEAAIQAVDAMGSLS